MEYFKAASYAPFDIPKDKAPIEIRPPSRSLRDCTNPSPSFPIRFSFGILQLSKISSAVSLARIPNLSSFFPPLNPGVPLSTIKADIPRESPFSPVLAITTATSPLLP